MDIRRTNSAGHISLRCFATSSIVGMILTFLVLLKRYNLGQTERALQLPFDLIDSLRINDEVVSTNATLDFGKIYYINLDQRHDRRDQIAMLSERSQIRMSRIPGVTVKSREETNIGYPQYSPEDMSFSKLGCYRSHANAWRTFLEDPSVPSTALILEDDIDWDIDIKNAIAKVKTPLYALDRSLSGLPLSMDTPPSWLSSDWDILRFGTCREPPHDSTLHARGVDLDELPYVTFDDDSVPDREWMTVDHQLAFDTYQIYLPSIQEDAEVKSRKRIIQLSNYPVCMHAYAITRRGAMKLLHITSQGLVKGANDVTIALATHERRLKSYSIIPSVFGQWKTQGALSNTDNGGSNTDPLQDPLGPQSFSWSVHNSIRMKLAEELA